jgi:hypothetical protein
MHDRDYRIIFVVGNSRSGTHLMSNILGNSPEVYNFRHELHFFEELWSPRDEGRELTLEKAEALVAKLLSIHRSGYLTQSDPGAFAPQARDIVDSAGGLAGERVFESFLRYVAAENGKSIPCDHTPRNVFYIGEIMELYPEARVVNMVRDPRDVLLSQKRKWRRRFLGGDEGAKYIPRWEVFRSWANYNPFLVSRLWRSSVMAAEKFEGDKRLMTVRFEDLVASPHETVEGVCGFLGLSFEPELLAVPLKSSSTDRDTISRTGVVNRAARWRDGGLGKSEIDVCQRITGKVMARHGYMQMPVSPGFSDTLYHSLISALKMALAFPLNIRRMKNPVEALKRRFS